MSRSLVIAALVLFSGCHTARPVTSQTVAVSPIEIEVLFSQDHHCTERIVTLIGETRRTIRVQAYGFTSLPIATALVDAHERGVDVQVVLDSKANLHEAASKGRSLSEAGITVTYDHAHAIAHNKIIILDGKKTIGGSMNYSHNAETANAENVTVIKSLEITRKFLDNWTLHHLHSVKP